MKETAWRLGSSIYWNLDIDRRVFGSYPRILMYHSIGVDGAYGARSTAQFRRQLKWLDDHHEIVDLDRVLTASSNGKKKIAITFDDGLASFYINALPIIEEFSVPVTVFVLGAAVKDHPELSPGQILQNRLETPERFMAESELQTLVEHPLVTIGGHSWSHPKLPEISDTEALQREIVDGTAAVESALDVSINRFAYPYNEWNDAVVDVVSDNFDLAVRGGGRRATISEKIDPVKLPRINAGIDLAHLQFDTADLSTYLRGS